MTSIRTKPLAVVIFCAALAAALPAWGQNQAPESKVDASTEDLRSLVSQLENEQQREKLINQLKTLIRLREQSEGPSAGRKEKPSVFVPEIGGAVKSFSDHINLFTEKTDRTIKQATRLALGIPDRLALAVAYYSERGNLIGLLLAIVYLVAGILAGAGFGKFLGRLKRKTPETKPSLVRRIWTGIGLIILRTSPYLVAFLVVGWLFRMTPAFIHEQFIVLYGFRLVFFYKLAVNMAGALLSPERPALRIISMTDENSTILLRRLIRLVKITVVYLFLVEIVLRVVCGKPLHMLLSNKLMILIPIMLTLFLVKLHRVILAEPAVPGPVVESETEPAPAGPSWRKKTMDLVRRFWLAPVIGYVWLVFLFLVGGLRSEFSYLFSATIGTLVTGLFFLVALLTVDYGFSRADTGEDTDRSRYLRVIRLLVSSLVFIVTAFILAQVWGLPVARFVTSPTGGLILTRFLVIFMTIGAAMLVISTSQTVTNWLLEEREGLERSQKTKTLTPIINTTIKAVAIFIGIVVVLDRMGVNVGPILAGAGIIGLGVGLGAQSLVKDFINGLFILFQDMISVGDWAQVGDKSGQVEAISLRAVRVRDLAGNVHIIPNSAIETVTNMTKGFSRYVFDIGVAYREDVDEVMEILAELGREMQADPKFGPNIISPLEILGLDRFDDSAIIIRARITTRPMKQWEVGREFNRRIKKTFDRLGIEIPFPHRTVYMGMPKEGDAPPLNIRTDKTPESPGES